MNSKDPEAVDTSELLRRLGKPSRGELYPALCKSHQHGALCCISRSPSRSSTLSNRRVENCQEREAVEYHQISPMMQLHSRPFRIVHLVKEMSESYEKHKAVKHHLKSLMTQIQSRVIPDHTLGQTDE